MAFYHCNNMRSTLKRIGNSQGVIIPKPLLAEAGLAGDVEISVERDAIVIRRSAGSAREGWAEASKRIAEHRDDVLAWPELANAGDDDLAW